MSYNHFTVFERESLSILYAQGESITEIARIIGKHKSSVSREIRRNTSKKKKRYNANGAKQLYKRRRKKCVRKDKLQQNTELYNYVVEKLKNYWTPEQIANRCKRDIGQTIACSTIYRAIKKKKLVDIATETHLRRRGKDSSKVHHNSQTIHPERTIHERPKVIELKERIGDYEGDTIHGKVGKGCLVTLVDRKSKLLLAAIAKNKSKEEVRAAFKRAFARLPIKLPIHSITLDNGSEFADFKRIEEDLNTQIYFTDPRAPWQRGLNENTNDLIRFFYSRKTSFNEISEQDLNTVLDFINNRPRKSLNYLSPLEYFSIICCT